MSDASLEFVTGCPAETIALGTKIAQALQGGEVIALVGELGTGKTHLTKGIAAGLKAGSESPVSSPTFTLINEYHGTIALYHVDAYRLENAVQLEALGFDELCSGAAVVVVEWADRAWSVIAAYDPIRITLEHRGESQRAIRIDNVPGSMRELTVDRP